VREQPPVPRAVDAARERDAVSDDDEEGCSAAQRVDERKARVPRWRSDDRLDIARHAVDVSSAWVSGRLPA